MTPAAAKAAFIVTECNQTGASDIGLQARIARAIEDAVLEEREACAKLADDRSYKSRDDLRNEEAAIIALQIRSRSGIAP